MHVCVWRIDSGGCILTTKKILVFYGMELFLILKRTLRERIELSFCGSKPHVLAITPTEEIKV